MLIHTHIRTYLCILAEFYFYTHIYAIYVAYIISMKHMVCRCVFTPYLKKTERLSSAMRSFVSRKCRKSRWILRYTRKTEVLFSVLCKKEEEEQESKEEAAEEDKSVTQRGQEEEDLRSLSLCLVPSGVKMLRHMCAWRRYRCLRYIDQNTCSWGAWYRTL